MRCTSVLSRPVSGFTPDLKTKATSQWPCTHATPMAMSLNYRNTRIGAATVDGLSKESIGMDKRLAVDLRHRDEIMVG